MYRRQSGHFHGSRGLDMGDLMEPCLIRQVQLDWSVVLAGSPKVVSTPRNGYGGGLKTNRPIIAASVGTRTN
jgi:hypothetical protein